MKHEMTISIEVPLTATLRFTPVKAVPGGRHEKPEPACIEDLEVVSIKYDSSLMNHQDVPLDVTWMKPTVDNALNYAVMGAKDWDEWTEICLESIEKDEVERQISRHEDSLDDPHVEERQGGIR